MTKQKAKRAVAAEIKDALSRLNNLIKTARGFGLEVRVSVPMFSLGNEGSVSVTVLETKQY